MYETHEQAECQQKAVDDGIIPSDRVVDSVFHPPAAQCSLFSRQRTAAKYLKDFHPAICILNPALFCFLFLLRYTPKHYFSYYLWHVCTYVFDGNQAGTNVPAPQNRQHAHAQEGGVQQLGAIPEPCIIKARTKLLIHIAVHSAACLRQSSIFPRGTHMRRLLRDRPL